MVTQNRYYSSTTKRTTTTADPGTSGTSLAVVDGSVFSSLDGRFPYAVVISTDGTDREVVYVTARSTNTLTVTRGRDGTSGVAHAVGSTVDHMLIGADGNELMAHMANSWVNVKDKGATGDGSTDDAAAVQAALDQASSTYAGSTVYFPSGTYKVNSELEIKGSCAIVMDEGCTVIRGSSSMQYIFRNFNSSYAPTVYGGRGKISFTGGTIDGGATSLTTSCTSVCIAHADTVSFDDVTFQNVVDWHGVELNSTRNGKVRNCTFQGLRIVTAGRHISEAVQIDLAINSTALPGIGAGAYDDTPCLDILIEGCTVRGLGSYGSFGAVTGSHSWADGSKHKEIRIIGNYGQDLNDYFASIQNYDDVVIANNTAVNCNSFLQIVMPASMTADMFNFAVTNNVVRGLGVQNNNTAVNDYGVQILGIDATSAGSIIRQVNFSGNVIEDVANNTNGIHLLNVSDMIFNGNVLQNMTGSNAAVRLTGCAKGVYSGNKIDGASGRGFHVSDGTNINSAHTVLSGNQVSFTGSGVSAFDVTSIKTNITGNTIYMNQHGRAIAFFGAADWCSCTNNMMTLADSITPAAGDAGIYNNSGNPIVAMGNYVAGWTSQASDAGADTGNHHAASGGWFPTAARTYNLVSGTSETS